MKVWIGTSGFQYPEWKGTFYPDDLPVSKMLSYYSERFAATEINYSFRRIPSPATITKWSGLTPEEFRFSLKAPQKVTHFAKLRNCAETMTYFHSVVVGLGAKLGPVLVQLPPTLAKEPGLLRSFLDSLPTPMRVAVEFRHPSWFDEETFHDLRLSNAALCLAESADLSTPRIITADFAYLRLRREDYGDSDLADWSHFLQAQAVPEAFVYFKHEESGVGPKFARSFQQLLGQP